MWSNPRPLGSRGFDPGAAGGGKPRRFRLSGPFDVREARLSRPAGRADTPYG